MMETADIIEFRTTWNNELFFKNRVTCLTAKRLIRKSLIIVQARWCRHLKLTENDLALQLRAAEEDRQLLSKFNRPHALSENLQQRLQALQNEIRNYSQQVKTLIHQEKDYWKQLERTIVKRANAPRSMKLSVPSYRPILRVVNATYLTDGNENQPPSDRISHGIEKESPAKVPRIRKKKRIVS